MKTENAQATPSLMSTNNPAKPRPRSRQNWLYLGLSLFGGAAVILWFLAPKAPPESMTFPQTVPVVQRDITVNVSAAGTVKSLTPVNISPKQAGRLAALYVQQGAWVKAGQLLARMDNSNLQGQRLQAFGSLQSAQANLHKLQAGNRPQEIQQASDNLRQAQASLIASKANYESNLQLYKLGAVSRNTLASNRSQYESDLAHISSLQQQLNLSRQGYRKEDIESAQAQVTQAQGNLKTIEAQIADTLIRAPFSGLVTQKFASPGAFVTPTTSASATSSATSSSILAMAGELEAVVAVAESDIRNIHKGQTVALQVDAYPDRNFRGQVRLIAPESVVTQNVTSFEVRVKILDDKQKLLKSGMNLNANFLVGTHKGALLIPTTAIVSTASGASVNIQSANGSLSKSIVTGATIDTQTEVLQGLEANDRVFITLAKQRQPNGIPVENKSLLPPPPK